MPLPRFQGDPADSFPINADNLGQVVGAVGSAVGDIVGGPVGAAATGVASYLGASGANEMNRKIAQETRDWQERMSNTSYQRAMQDMRTAGLNPMLAYNLGGASTPSTSLPRVENPLAGASGAFSSAVDVRRARAEIANMSAQRRNLEAQTAQIRSQTLLNQASSAKSVVSTVKDAAGLVPYIKHYGKKALGYAGSVWSILKSLRK